MTILASDITFTYSGGAGNSDSAQSLGGDPSTTLISSSRLFSDVTPEQSAAGRVDYRCFYLHNENASDVLYNTEVSFFYDVPGDVSLPPNPTLIRLAIYSSNEQQDVTIVGIDNITSGSFELTYTDVDGNHDFVVAWNADASTWANNFQTAIQAISGLEDVIISANLSFSGTTLIFEIAFDGTAGNRFHDLIVMKTNSLVSSGTTTVSIHRTVNGGPINSIADEIDVATTAPNNLTFVSETVFIGDFRPTDLIPIWVRRTTPAESSAIENNGFTFRLFGNPIP